MTVRQRPLPPQLDNPRFAVSVQPVCIYHPDYDNKSFIAINAHEPVPGMPGVYGIHHQTALDACRIIANNEDGFLSRTQDRTGRVPASEVLLCERAYWYHLTDESRASRYPIVDDFDAWTFPHGAVPPHWAAAHTRTYDVRASAAASGLSERIKALDRCCIVTGYDTPEVLAAAPLVPAHHDAWFRHHDMRVYNASLLPGVGDTANGVALRADLRRCLDGAARLVFVPLGGAFVAHFLGFSRDYVQALHNVRVALPARVPVEFVYARFARNVLSAVRAEVVRGVFRTVPMPDELRRGGQRLHRSDPCGGESALDVESGGNDAEEMDALRTRYFAENPQVRQVSGSEA